MLYQSEVYYRPKASGIMTMDSLLDKFPIGLQQKSLRYYLHS